jgi:hypothetical protein
MRSSTQIFRFLAAATLCLAITSALRAQAPAGPIHPSARVDSDSKVAPPPEVKKTLVRHDLWGSWGLNSDRSDDPRKKMQDTGSNRGGNGPIWAGGPGSGGVYSPGGVFGRDSAADRERTNDVVDPAERLTLARHDAEIDITDDTGLKRALFTDGRKLQKSKDVKYRELAAHWDGQRLVADEKGPNGLKVTRSYEISTNGQQLYETLAVDRGSFNGGFVMIRYVYDPPKEEAKDQTQPDKPGKSSSAETP